MQEARQSLRGGAVGYVGAPPAVSPIQGNHKRRGQGLHLWVSLGPQKHCKVGTTQPACAEPEPGSRDELFLVSLGGGYHLLPGTQQRDQRRHHPVPTSGRSNAFQGPTCPSAPHPKLPRRRTIGSVRAGELVRAGKGVGRDTQEAALFLEPRFKETQDAKFCPSHCGCGGGSLQPGALLSGGGGASGPEARRPRLSPH